MTERQCVLLCTCVLGANSFKLFHTLLPCNPLLYSTPVCCTAVSVLHATLMKYYNVQPLYTSQAVQQQCLPCGTGCNPSHGMCPTAPVAPALLCLAIPCRADGRAMPMKTSSWQEFFSEPEDAPLASACTSGMRSTATATTATAPVPTTTDERVNPIAISPQHAPLAQMSFAGNIQRDAHISFTPPGLITYSYKWPGGGGVSCGVWQDWAKRPTRRACPCAGQAWRHASLAAALKWYCIRV